MQLKKQPNNSAIVITNIVNNVAVFGGDGEMNTGMLISSKMPKHLAIHYYI